MSESSYEKRTLEIKWHDSNSFFIVKQSHRGSDFIPKEYKKGSFISNGVELLSKSFPEIKIEGTNIFLFTMGDNSTKDHKTCFTPYDLHDTINAVVADYNDTFNGSLYSMEIDRPIRLDMSDKSLIL